MRGMTLLRTAFAASACLALAAWLYAALQVPRAQDSNVLPYPADDWPSWSPDGRLLAFHSSRNPQGPPGLDISILYTAQATGGGSPKQIVSRIDAAYPQWSPNGLLIALELGDHVYVLDPASEDLAPVTPNTGIDGMHPSWSADGKWIVFVSTAGGEDMDLMRVRYEGSGRRRHRPERLLRMPGDQQIPVCSPDGRWIAFVSAARVGDEEGCDVMVCDTRGQNVATLRHFASDVQRLTWFPDSDRLFVQLWKPEGDGDSRHRILRVSDRSVAEVNPGPDHPLRSAESATLSPDGNRIAFSATPEGQTYSLLFTCALNGDDLQQVTDP